MMRPACESPSDPMAYTDVTFYRWDGGAGDAVGPGPMRDGDTGEIEREIELEQPENRLAFMQ
jgi:hypothetical protein